MKKRLNDDLYPDQFDDYSGGEDVNDEMINEWIKNGYDHLNDYKDEIEYSVAWGNTIVIMTRISSGIAVIVAKDYQEYYMECDHSV